MLTHLFDAATIIDPGKTTKATIGEIEGRR